MYSSYHVMGEGEHKILSHIKQNINTDAYVIYGLDADLIFLAFASQKNNLYLYRENKQLAEIFKNVTPGFCYVDIDLIKNKYCDKIQEMASDDLDICCGSETDKKKKLYDNKRLINDFVILCFFIGNDFLPSIPSICIKHHGLHDIINTYVYTLNRLKTYLLDENYELNTIFFEEFIIAIVEYELKQTKNINKTSDFTKKCPETEPYKIDLWKLDNMQYLKKDDLDLISGNMDHIKSRYYSHYLGIGDYYNQSVEFVIKNYIEGILWNIKYYFDKCPSYTWYYPFHVAPFFSDIMIYIKDSNWKFATFNNKIRITPIKQLLLVIPKEYKDVIPKTIINYLDKHKDNDIFISNLKLDTANKHVYWKCTPFLPLINLEKTDLIYSNVKLSEDEKTRDKIYDDPIIL